MDLALSRKKVLVTGGSRGVGLGIAKSFAAEGADIILVSREISEEEVRAKLGDFPGTLTTVNTDLSRPGTAELLAERFSEVDILINNAGAVPAGSLQDVDEPTWRAAWDLKIFGYINMCRAFYPRMTTNGGGVIINIAGIGAIIKNSSAICVAAGNAAIVVFSQALGSSSPKDNIRVIAVNPGPVATERLLSMSATKGNQKFNVAASLPWGRAAQVEEVASAIAFLASARSSYTSGSVVTIDGGISASAQGL